MAPPFTNRLHPLRNQAERRCNAPRFRPQQVGMLPLPRVGGALSGALEGSIAGTGGRVKRRGCSRPRPRFARGILHHFNRTTMPVSTNAPAHSQSMLNQALRRRLRPSFRYTIHAASTITVKYAAE